MAQFNPNISTNLGDNYTTRSQGQTPNKAFAYLFGGIADAVTSFKNNQKEQAAQQKAQDELNFDNDIGGAANDVASVGMEGPRYPIPGDRAGRSSDFPENYTEIAEIDNTVSSLARLQQGVSQGKVTQVRMDMERAQKVQELMSKYPHIGRAEIEKRLSVAMGHSALADWRKSHAELIDEQNKFASDEEKRVKGLKKEWANAGYLDPNSEVAVHYEQLTKSKLNPLGDINEDAMNIAIAKEANIEKVMQRHEAELRIAEGDDKAISRIAEKKASEAMQMATQKLFYTAMNVDKARIGYLMRRGKDITVQEQQELLAKVSEMEGQLNMTADTILGKYSSYIRDNARREDIKRIMTGPFETIKKLVEDKNFGVLGAVTNYHNAVKNADDLEFYLKNGQFMQNLELAQKKYGSTAVSDFFDPTKNLGVANQNEEQQALYDKIALDIYGGNVPVADVLNQLKTLQLDQKDAGVVFKGIQKAINAGLGPDMSKEQAAEYFKKTLFSPEGGNILRGMQDPGRVLSMFVNPLMTEKLHGTTTWDEYTAFAMNQAAVVMRPIGDKIVDTQKYTYRGVVAYDEKTGKFALDTQGVGIDPIDYRATQNGQAAVSQMNQYMDAMKPILDKEGIKPDQFLQGVFAEKEFRKVSKEGSWLQRMGESFGEKMQELREEYKKSNEGTENPAQQPGIFGPGVSTRSPILGLIHKAEGAGYNTLFGGGKADLSSKTVAEVLEMQKTNTKKLGSSATGSVQVMRDTLAGLVKNGVVKLSEKFTPQLQDRIGHALLERRGYSRFIAGELDIEDFADNLAQEWASFPTRSGKSYYEKDGVNKATISRKQFIEELEKLKQ